MDDLWAVRNICEDFECLTGLCTGKNISAKKND